MMEPPTNNGQDDFQESDTNTMHSWRRTEQSPSIMGQFFCKGMPTEESESILSIESSSIVPYHPTANNTSRIRRNFRQPLQATSLGNKKEFSSGGGSNNSSSKTDRSLPSNAGTCFSNAVASLLPAGTMEDEKGIRAKMCGCVGHGACGSCWDTKSTTRVLPSLPSPQESYSNPVIEALGVTPKSRDRWNKYSVTQAMNSPGLSISTPAPNRRKKYTPVFTTVPETISTSSGMSLNKHGSADEDAFLPDDFTETKENAVLYTEADLRARIQEALANQEIELVTKFASESSEESKDWEVKMQEQLEEQGALWNKDLLERLAATKDHYRRKQTALKNRVAELEKQCHQLKDARKHDRSENERKTELLLQEIITMKESNEVERTKMLKENARQSGMLSLLEKEKCTPGYIRDLQTQVSSLRAENQDMANREAGLKEQVGELEEHVQNLESSMEVHIEGRRHDQQEISDLGQQLETMEHEKYLVEVEVVALNEKLECRNSDLASLQKRLEVTESKMKASQRELEEKTIESEKIRNVLQQCLDRFSAQLDDPAFNADSSNPYDEAECIVSVDTLLQRFEQQSQELVVLFNKTRSRLQEAENESRLQTGSKSATALEIQRPSKVIQSSPGGIGDATNAEKPANSSDEVGGPQKESGASQDQQQSEMEHLEFQAASIGSMLDSDFCCGHPESLPFDDAVTEGIVDISAPFLKDFDLQNPHLLTTSCIATSDVFGQLLRDMESMKCYLQGTNAVGVEEIQMESAVNDVSKLRALVQNICTQIVLLRERHSQTVEDHDKLNREVQVFEKTLTLTGGRVSKASSNGLREQLEKQRLALARKEKQHVDAMRKIQKLSQQLKDIQSRKESSSGSGQSGESTTQPVEERGDGSNQANKQATHLRSEIQEMEKEHTENTRGEQIQIDELMVMLELKQKNEELSNKFRELEETASLSKEQKEQLEQEVSRLTQKCQELENSLDEKDNSISSLEKHISTYSQERSILNQKLDSMITQIDDVESEQGLKGGDSGSGTKENEMVDKNECHTAVQKIERIEFHMQNVWGDFTMKKVAELTSQRALLSKMQQQIATHKEESAQTIQQLNTKISELEHDIDAKQERVEVADTEIESLKKELSKSVSDVSAAVTSRQEAVESLKSLEAEKQSLSKTVSSLETQLESIKREKELAEVAAVEQNEIQEALDMSRQEASKLQKQLEESTTEASNLRSKIQEVESLLEASQCELTRVSMLLEVRSGTMQEDLLKRTKELEEKSALTIERCEEQVRQVKEDHAKEIDEMLAQLDLVEAEQNDRCAEKEKMLKEKDAIIAALGTQLAESQNRIGVLENLLSEHSTTIEQAQSDFSRIKADSDSLKAELENLREINANLLESERIKREKAIEEARDETIQEAELQFKKANSLYRNLVQEYKNEQAKCKELESDLEKINEAVEKEKKEHAAKLASLNSDLAELKAAQAQADATAARTVKEQLADIERLIAAEKNLQSQLAQAEQNNKSFQTLLANLAAEKQQLLAENEELRFVCEEAMSLAENSTTVSTTK